MARRSRARRSTTVLYLSTNRHCSAKVRHWLGHRKHGRVCHCGFGPSVWKYKCIDCEHYFCSSHCKDLWLRSTTSTRTWRTPMSTRTRRSFEWLMLDKPMLLLDTHASRGMCKLTSEEATRSHEHLHGRPPSTRADPSISARRVLAALPLRSVCARAHVWHVRVHGRKHH
jgi:hypothetical protein